MKNMGRVKVCFSREKCKGSWVRPECRDMKREKIYIFNSRVVEQINKEEERDK
jgi:hypothetical protein